MSLPDPSSMGNIAQFYFDASSTQVYLFFKRKRGKPRSNHRFRIVGGITPERFDEWLQQVDNVGVAFTRLPLPESPNLRFYVPTEKAGTYTPEIARTIVQSSRAK